jgi:hypothetical protein
LRDVFFKTQVGTIEKAYNDLFGGLVLLPDSSLPDVCVVCGGPANGNVHREKFKPFSAPSWHVPIFYDVVYGIIGKQYVVDFPVCATCEREGFEINLTQIDERVGVFSGASKTFLRLLPVVTPEVASQMEGTWPQRILRFVMH